MADDRTLVMEHASESGVGEVPPLRAGTEVGDVLIAVEDGDEASKYVRTSRRLQEPLIHTGTPQERRAARTGGVEPFSYSYDYYSSDDQGLTVRKGQGTTDTEKNNKDNGGDDAPAAARPHDDDDLDAIDAALASSEALQGFATRMHPHKPKAMVVGDRHVCNTVYPGAKRELGAWQHEGGVGRAFLRIVFFRTTPSWMLLVAWIVIGMGVLLGAVAEIARITAFFTHPNSKGLQTYSLVGTGRYCLVIVPRDEWGADYAIASFYTLTEMVLAAFSVVFFVFVLFALRYELGGFRPVVRWFIYWGKQQRVVGFVIVLHTSAYVTAEMLASDNPSPVVFVMSILVPLTYLVFVFIVIATDLLLSCRRPLQNTLVALMQFVLCAALVILVLIYLAAHLRRWNCACRRGRCHKPNPVSFWAVKAVEYTWLLITSKFFMLLVNKIFVLRRHPTLDLSTEYLFGVEATPDGGDGVLPPPNPPNVEHPLLIFLRSTSLRITQYMTPAQRDAANTEARQKAIAMNINAHQRPQDATASDNDQGGGGEIADFKVVEAVRRVPEWWVMIIFPAGLISMYSVAIHTMGKIVEGQYHFPTDADAADGYSTGEWCLVYNHDGVAGATYLQVLDLMSTATGAVFVVGLLLIVVLEVRIAGTLRWLWYWIRRTPTLAGLLLLLGVARMAAVPFTSADGFIKGLQWWLMFVAIVMFDFVTVTRLTASPMRVLITRLVVFGLVFETVATYVLQLAEETRCFVLADSPNDGLDIGRAERIAMDKTLPEVHASGIEPLVEEFNRVLFFLLALKFARTLAVKTLGPARPMTGFDVRPQMSALDPPGVAQQDNPMQAQEAKPDAA